MAKIVSGANHLTAWRMPIARNLNFTGRDTTLLTLRNRLTGSDLMARAQVLHGAGGIGKTQTAAEYVYRFRESYGLIWWIPASNPATLELSLAELARTLGLSDRKDVGASELRRLLFAHLATRSDWLLILDDAADAPSIAGLLPTERTGHLLITSRNPNWGEVARSFPVGLFDRQESVDFLLHRTGRKETPETVDRLAAALGDMPLALDQAAALIEQTRISFGDYLTRFETHWAELLKAGKTSADYPMSIAMSWELSFQQVEERSEAAAQILAICSFLAPEGIPRSLLRSLAQYAPPGLGFILGDLISTGQALAELANFSLVEIDDRTVRMHPLAAGLARARLSDDERQTWAGVAVRAMEPLFSYDAARPEQWREMADLLPHALAAASNAEASQVSLSAARSIYNVAGQHLLTLARYNDASRYLLRALDIAGALWGENSPRLSPISNNLGRVLLRLGDVASARPHFERALSLDEHVYGSSHPHVAEIVNNRGVCLHLLGSIDAAEADFRRALEIYHFNFGDGYAKIASIINNLAYSMIGRGDLKGAREQFAEALKLAQSSLGNGHPTVAAVLRNLGKVYISLHQPASARTCFDKAYQIDQQALGPNHPDVASDLAGQGEVAELLGEFPKAKGFLTRAITAEQSMESPDVSRLVERYNLLSRVHRKMGEADESRRCADRAAELSATRTESSSESGLLESEAGY